MEIQEFEYLENKKSFLVETKTFFKVFEGLSFGEKYKFDKKQQTQALRGSSIIPLEGFCKDSVDISYENASFFILRSPWYRGQIGIELGIKNVIYPMLAFFSVEKKYLC